MQALFLNHIAVEGNATAKPTFLIVATINWSCVNKVCIVVEQKLALWQTSANGTFNLGIAV